MARLRSLDVETQVLPLSGKVRDVRKDSLGLAAAVRHLEKIPHFSTYAASVAQFARRHNADIIHTNSLKADLYGALAGRLARVPVVWHVRDRIEPTYLPRPAVRMFRLLARKLPAYVVANSQSTLETLFLGGARPSAIVPSGIDSDEIGTRDERVRTEDRGPVRIGIVGRIARWKGQHIFLEAAARVIEAGHDTQFVIVGTPLFGEESYEEEIRRQVRDSGIESRVEFLGFRKDIPQVLRSLDILVHASTTPEPFGQVVVEGMAAGLPVIGTDGGGVREIITHDKTGLLVPMSDAPALTRALDGLLRDPERRNAWQSRGRIMCAKTIPPRSLPAKSKRFTTR